ncbi:uncharacterized protein DUF2484 [Loktanella sp. PT4BL]|uniref:DUF2484 family protein n=1 Tax=Loktanella sp. PT4BL TaxID=2135611 RepID=UPI000D999A12|nr:DUF2484 family protein [Loktanella sp. PT4BL]PXW70915.1 uncharacterized protein DUF2484 [Loktanella sp. PT4BL]
MGERIAGPPERVKDPVILIGLWVVLAFALSAFPSNDSHWRRAYVLLAIGAPLLVWITIQHGIFMGLLGLAVGGLVLRWPVYYLWRWIKNNIARS